MASIPAPVLEKQVKRVRGRLFLQACVNRLIVAWTAGCGLMAVWLLAKPYLLNGTAKLWMDWAAGGTIFGLATIVAVVLAIRRMPSLVAAALALDERFKLRERVTTSLTLSEDEKYTPAGQALLADAQAKATGLRVGAQFPIKLGWKSALVPVSAAGLALLAVFYDPVIPQPQGQAATATPLPPEAIKEIEQKKQEYLQRPKSDPAKPERPKTEDMQRIEAKVEEILKRPATTDKEVKDRLAELTSLEEQLRKKEKEDAERVQGFQEQLQKAADQLQKKDKSAGKNQDGPAKDLKDKLAKGEMDKAKEEVERLGKKIKDGDQINKKDKEQLAQELKDMKEELERVAKEKEKEDEEKRQEREKKLEEQFKEGKIDKEELDREKKKIDEERKKTSNTQELADKLGKCEKCLNDGDNEGAAKALQEAAEQLDKMQNDQQSLDDLQGELQRMSDLRDSMGKACDKCNGGRQSSEDDAETLSRNSGDEGDSKGQGSGSGKGRKGVGRRPENKAGDSKSVDAKQKSPFDRKGAKIQVGTAEGKSLKGLTGPSLDGEIKQASQDAPDAIDAQRIPRGYKDSAKGYFKNIGGQQTGEMPKKQ
jgi:hypothetical protein